MYIYIHINIAGYMKMILIVFVVLACLAGIAHLQVNGLSNENTQLQNRPLQTPVKQVILIKTKMNLASTNRSQANNTSPYPVSHLKLDTLAPRKGSVVYRQR